MADKQQLVIKNKPPYTCHQHGMRLFAATCLLLLTACGSNKHNSIPHTGFAPIVVNSRFTTAAINNRVLVSRSFTNSMLDTPGLAQYIANSFLPNTDDSRVPFGLSYNNPDGWICFLMENKTALPLKMVVDINHIRSDTLEGWLLPPGAAKPVYLGKVYRALPLAQRPYPVYSFALPFILPATGATHVLLHCSRSIGVHEVMVSVSTEQGYLIKNANEVIQHISALVGCVFFLLALFALGVTFKHRLLIKLGFFLLQIVLAQVHVIFLFEGFAFPAFMSLNANNLASLFIFSGLACLHVFGLELIGTIAINQPRHKAIAYILCATAIAFILLHFYPVTHFTNVLITNGVLILVTVNIVWAFYLACQLYLKNRQAYALVSCVVFLLPFLLASYLKKQPQFDGSFCQPIYFLAATGYIVFVLLRNELTTRRTSEQHIKKLQADLEEVRKNEIAQIGRNLHDQLGNTLASALGYLNLRRPNVAVSKKMILAAINETRVISHNLVKNDGRPLDEKLADITERFNDFSATAFVFNDFSEGQLTRLSTLKQENMYMIVQEALNNIVKHSQATEAYIQVFAQDGNIRLSIEDDGIGGAGQVPGEGIGIKNMHKRAALAGLKLNIDFGVTGTCLSIETAGLN